MAAGITGLACTVTRTRPATALGTSSRSSREWAGSLSGPLSAMRSQCEPRLRAPLFLVFRPPVPPMVTMADEPLPYEGPAPLLEPPAVEGQADFQRSRTRGPYLWGEGC